MTMSLLVVYHPISCAESVPRICYFAWNLSVIFKRNDVMWTMSMRVMQMSSKAFPVILTHLRKVMKHSSSSGCISLQNIIPFSMLTGCLKSDILHKMCVLFLAEKIWCGPHKGLVDATKSSSNHLCMFKEGYKTLKQLWIPLLVAQYLIIHVEGVHKIWCFAWNLGWVLNRNDTMLIIRGLYMLCKAHIIILIHLRMVKKTLKHQ